MSVLVVRDQRARVLALQSATPTKLEWINAAETYRCMDEIDAKLDPDAPERDRPAIYLRQVPPPKLMIDDPGFALNAFFLGVWFVSAKLRAALDLGEDDVVYRTADITNSAARLPALAYAAMAPVHHADGIDPDLSDIERMGEPDGTTTDYWELATSGAEPPRVTLRSGFTAPAPLFFMDRTDWLMITEEAAQRVRSAGIEDLVFDQPSPAYGSWMLARS